MDDFVSKYITSASLLKNKIESGADLDTWDRALLLVLIDFAIDKIFNDFMEGK